MNLFEPGSTKKVKAHTASQWSGFFLSFRCRPRDQRGMAVLSGLSLAVPLGGESGSKLLMTGLKSKNPAFVRDDNKRLHVSAQFCSASFHWTSCASTVSAVVKPGASAATALLRGSGSISLLRYAPSTSPKNTIADTTPVKIQALCKPLLKGRSTSNPSASITTQAAPLEITGQLIGTSNCGSGRRTHTARGR